MIRTWRLPSSTTASDPIATNACLGLASTCCIFISLGLLRNVLHGGVFPFTYFNKIKCDLRFCRVRHGYAHVANNLYLGWEVYAIGGSSNPSIKSDHNLFVAPKGKSKEVKFLYAPLKYKITPSVPFNFYLISIWSCLIYLARFPLLEMDPTILFLSRPQIHPLS